MKVTFLTVAKRWIFWGNQKKNRMFYSCLVSNCDQVHNVSWAIFNIIFLVSDFGVQIIQNG